MNGYGASGSKAATKLIEDRQDCLSSTVPVPHSLHRDWLPARPDKLPQHERKDSAVLVVLHFDRRIDAQRNRYVLRLAVRTMNRELHFLLRAQRRQAGDVECLGAIELERLRVRAFIELQRQHAHADEIGAVNALEALGHDCANAKEAGALRGPVA